MTGVSGMYAEANTMLKGIHKSSYAANMERFRKVYAGQLRELLTAAEQDGPQTAAEQLVESLKSSFSVRGRIPARVQVDLNAFTVYYVLPALALTEDLPCFGLIDAICGLWPKAFRRSTIHFASYETILNSFQRSFLGIQF